MGGSPDSAAGADLGSFVPRLVADWMAEAPDGRYRQIPGSMVFTDLTGFTAMSEKLATLGRLGAEELVHHLDDVFCELLEVAGGYGASLLKFGGDALLLFLWGGQHERRAAAAAVRMQERLAEVGAIHTSAGRIRLAMTVGVHAGDFDFFLVGESHRELLVCGPATTRTVALESSAQPGQVIVSGAISAPVRDADPGAVGPRRGKGVLLERAPRGVEPGDHLESSWPPEVQPDQFVPALLREEIGRGLVLPEHRQMAVAFCHLAIVDEMLQRQGPDITAEALDRLMVATESIMADHGVALVASDVYDDGPKLVWYTGAVRSWENDDERLLRALREVLDLDSPITRRIGVHRGHGFRGTIGPPWRRTFAAMGDVVNTAARVSAKAGPGELLSTRAPLERSDTVFETEELPPFAAKGKAEPLVAHRVGAITGTRERLATHRTTLVGRERELAELLAHVEAAGSGNGRLVELVGEAGLGKSRLLDEMVERVPDGHLVCRAQCGRYGQSSAYLPIRVLLRSLVGGASASDLRGAVRRHAPELEPWLPLLAIPLDVTVKSTPEVDRLDLQFVRGRLHEVVGDFVVAAISQPTVWVVEDSHWADGASRALLVALAERIPHAPLTLIVTRRPDGEPLAGTAGSVALGPLDVHAAERIIRDAAPRPLLPQQVAELAARAQGNPLYLEELAAALGEDHGAELPDTVEGVIAARIDALDVVDRRTVRHLAVLGVTTDVETARAVVDDLPDQADRSRWRRLHAFVERRGRSLRFKHALTRDVAYGGLSYAQRRVLHLAAARHLEATDAAPVELLALHFSEGRAHERAILYTRQAAEVAERKYAFPEAADLWRRGADAAQRLGDSSARIDALHALAVALQRSGDYGQAIEHLKRARRAAGPADRRRAELDRLLGRLYNLQGRFNLAERWFRRALDSPEIHRSATLRGRVLIELGALRDQQGRFGEAGELAEQAIEALRDEGDPESLALARSLRFSAAVDLDETDIVELGRAVLHEIEPLDQPRTLAAHLNTWAVACKRCGDWDTASSAYLEAADLNRRCGSSVNAAVAELNLAELLGLQGRYSEAVELYRSSVATLDAAGTWAAGVAALSLGRALLCVGDQREGCQWIQWGADRLGSVGISAYDASVRLFQVEGRLRAGDLDPGDGAILDRLATEDDADVRLPALRLRGHHFLLEGRHEEGLQAFDAARAAAEEAGRPDQVGMALHALAQLTADADARARATEIFERLRIVENPDVPIPAELHRDRASV